MNVDESDPRSPRAHRATTIVFFVMLAGLYLAALASSVHFAWQICSEYFPGGTMWLVPGILIVGAVVLVGLDVAFRRNGSSRALATTVALIGLTLFNAVGPFAHLFFWLIPQRIRDCNVYESPCDETRRRGQSEARPTNVQF